MTGLADRGDDGLEGSAASVVELLRARAAGSPDRVAYTFLPEGGAEAPRLTFAGLDARARAIGAALQREGGEGGRALLLFPPGLEFVAAFLGCLYAGAVAVPAYPPHRKRGLNRLSSIAADAEPSLVLTTSALSPAIQAWAAQTPRRDEMRLLPTDLVAEDEARDWRDPGVGPDALAFLQYTSGSTGDPKGVMVTHGNIVSNEEMIRRAFEQRESSVIVSWLPLYHDMGLIGGVLQPLYVGASCVLMSPVSFLQRPRRWLEVISEYRATTSGGPNFAYDLCVRKIPPAEREGLDLSSWMVAFNGAEPVRAETMERFARAFGPQGFRARAFYPCYGLAEATLFVTGGEAAAEPRVASVSAAALQEGRAADSDEGGRKALVDCGWPRPGQQVLIVDPETRRPCAPGRVGEIWVAGAGVARGYWNRPEETGRVFGARLSAEGAARGAEVSYLRTGDLGFLDDGRLFVTGRLKDMIVVRGRNLYPQDIEYTVESRHPSLRPGCGAAFSITVEDEERVVVVQEVDRRLEGAEAEAVVADVCGAVAQEHELSLHDVVLVRAGSIPKTSSGKIRRRACREGYLAGSLDAVARRAPGTPETAEEEAGEAALRGEDLVALDAGERRPLVVDFLKSEAARVLRLSPSRLDERQPLVSLGMDSLAAVELKHAVEERLGVSVSLSALLDEAGVADVADEILGGLERAAGVPRGGLPSAGPQAESPLSHGQRGLWFVQQVAPESGAYHIPVVIQITGDLDVRAMQTALRAVVERHPALRASFEQAPDGEPFQRVRESAGVDFNSADAESWDDETLARRLNDEAWRPFDLSRGPLLRAALFRRSGREHVLALTVHHLVADLRSLVVVFDELTALYLGHAAGAAPELKPPPALYSDYVAWERARLGGAAGERLWDYWRKTLAEPLPTLDLPTDRPRPPVQTYRGASKALSLGPELAGQLQSLARSSGSSLFVLLLAAFKVMLHRYTGQTDILVGSPAAGRNAPGTEDVVGYFVNPLALRTDASGAPSFRQMLGRVRRATLGALEHSEYPFPLLAARLNLARDPSRTPLFQVMFALQKAQPRGGESLSAFALGETGAAVRFGDLTFRSLSLTERQAPFDLMLMVAEGEGDLSASLQFNRDLFDDETAGRILEQFGVLLRAAVADPDVAIGGLDMLTPAERRRLLGEWNATAAEFERGRLVHELFEAQAERTPDAVALVAEDATLSYSALESRANRLARRLRRAGVAPGSVVGIHVERSSNLAVAILGVLKAGAAYLPLDPSHPRERLGLILENARVPLVITGGRLHSGLDGSGARLLPLDAEWGDISRESDERLPRLADPEQAAYLLYTSGSTGRPKGVAVPHRAVVNFLTTMAREPGLKAEDVFVSVTTASFDIFGLELYLPLMKGARLVLPSQETTADGAKLIRTLEEHRATAMQATPATWRLLLAAGWRGGPGFKLLCGGEALDGSLAEQLVALAPSVWNLYGPTETTIWSSVHKVSAEDAGGGYVPVGRPIANTTLYVLDAQLQPAPTGAAGELFIGGDGLAQGYWELPALTAEKFLPDHLGGRAGARMYRTGDLARWRADGVLEFLGRLDNQVKVRGFRVELGEIEAALAKCAGVRQAVVAAWKEAGGGQALAGYVVPAEPASPPDAAGLRRSLLELLPEPFVPSSFVLLDGLPLTPNGKVDRKALPKPESRRAAQAADYVAPRSEVERLVAETWRQTLGVEKVGLDDNFFDLGGHSLLLAQVQSRLSKAGREVSMLDLLRHPTVGALAARLEREGADSAAAQEGVRRGEARRSAGEAARRDVAIVGMAGRFPKAGDVGEFWGRLSRGEECISFFSDEELAESGVAPDVLGDPDYVKAGGVLESAEMFDAAFFGYHPREAELMDPQHRVFLECAWHALEDAGYDSERYGGRVGVFGGAGLNTYLHEIAPTLSNSSALRYQAFIGNDKDFVTTRVSYKLNLRGPSVNVQSACSTSLVAVHLACQSLLNGECDMALAGGVAVRAPLRQGYFYEEGGILSPDAHCRAFDKDARGTVFGNGVGVVVLKPLDRALADGDHVYAVIKGSAVNNDGSLKLGYTAPSVDGQAEVIAEALALSGVRPETVTYVEAHGTGTPLGDPIEVAALHEAFRGRAGEKQFCAIGSVKANIGHLDTAAGVAGLIKTVCALRHRALPPSINFAEPNPKIDFAGGPFYVNTSLAEWRSDGAPRRAGVSSFGIGGTNAHVILEEAPAAAPAGDPTPWRVLTLSARTGAALDKATRNLAERLKGDAELDLDDVAYTTQVGRRAFAHRRVVVCADRDDAVAALESSEPGRLLDGFHEGAAPSVAFLFPGQGTQHVNMARELYENEPAFASELDACVELLKPHLGADLRDLIFPPEERAEEAARELEQTAFAQPALFAVEYALARLWMSWGVRPAAMIGHSIGEYVAACLAGVFSLEDALRLVAARGRLMQSMPGGSMTAVGRPEEEVSRLLPADISLAAVNEPSGCVVSGPPESVERFEQELARREIGFRRLHTSHAFHSAMMEPVLEAFARELRQTRLSAPETPFISGLTGAWITAEQATDAGYWARQLRHAVRFSQGLTVLLAEPERVFVEVGPGRTLTALAARHAEGRGRVLVPSLRHPREETPDESVMLESLGRLWLAGVRADWRGFYEGERRRRVPLPHYPFERQRFWLEPRARSAGRPEADGDGAAAVKKPNLSEWFYLPSWKPSLPPPPAEELRDVWLILLDEGEFGRALASRLAALGRQVSTVEMGGGFSRRDETGYTVRPGSAEDYRSLLEDLRGRGRAPRAVVHAFSLTNAAAAGYGVAEFERVQEYGFYSLLSLLQAVAPHADEEVAFTVVSNSAVAASGDETLSPEKSTMLGLCRVAAQELPNISARFVDVKLPDAPTPAAVNAVLDSLMPELSAGRGDEVVAYRGRRRYVQGFEQVRPEASPGVTALREQGVYLITGGLTGNGFAVARYLARTVKARLVLVEREPVAGAASFDDPGNGHQPQAAAGAAAAAEPRLQRLAELTEAGAEVFLVAADAADEAQLTRAWLEGEARFGAIHGVVHAEEPSGERAFRAVLEAGREDCALHFRPKAHALYALERVLRDREADFCVVLSSVAAVLGGVGYGPYAAANLFMDSFVRSSNQTNPTPWMSLNCDLWLGEDGREQVAELRGDLSELGMTAREGEEVFRLALSARGLDQLLVSTVDLPARLLAARTRFEGLRARQKQGDGAGAARHERPPLPTPYVAPETEMEQRIAAVWQQVLGFEPVGVEDNFFDLGGDSLVAIQVASRLKQALDMDFPVAKLYQGVTVRSLAQLLSEGEDEERRRRAAEQAERQQAVGRRAQYIERRRSLTREVEG